jgi:hypothetical protein
MPTRRDLRFDTLADAVREARHALAAGYTRAGNWSLGQVCHHLALWIRYPLDGFPRLTLWERPLAWSVRNTFGPKMLRRVINGARVPRGIPAPLWTVPPASVPDAEGVDAYETQVGRLNEYAGVPYPSPLLGPLSGDELRAISRIHAAHHLSFLIPNNA